MTTINAIGTQWWRFEKYELRDGLIRPASRSSLKIYDLWKTYTDRKVEAEKPEGRSRRVKKHPRRFKSGPLESLLTLAGRIRFRPEFVLGQWAGPAGTPQIEIFRRHLRYLWDDQPKGIKITTAGLKAPRPECAASSRQGEI